MPQPHPHDIIMVTNIWTDAPKDLVIRSTTQQTIQNKQSQDASGMDIPELEFKQIEHAFRPAEAFEIKWNGRVYRLAPGQSRALPRYIATHFAKKIADQILGMQDLSGKLGYINSATKRPEVMSQILGEVVTYSGGDDEFDPNEQVLQKAERINDGIDNGAFDPLLGHLEPEPVQPESKPEVAQSDEEEPQPEDPFSKRSKSDLLKEAQDLNLEVTGRESKPELIELIKRNFA